MKKQWLTLVAIGVVSLASCQANGTVVSSGKDDSTALASAPKLLISAPMAAKDSKTQILKGVKNNGRGIATPLDATKPFSDETTSQGDSESDETLSTAIASDTVSGFTGEQKDLFYSLYDLAKAQSWTLTYDSLDTGATITEKYTPQYLETESKVSDIDTGETTSTVSGAVKLTSMKADYGLTNLFAYSRGDDGVKVQGAYSFTDTSGNAIVPSDPFQLNYVSVVDSWGLSINDLSVYADDPSYLQSTDVNWILPFASQLGHESEARSGSYKKIYFTQDTDAHSLTFAIVDDETFTPGDSSLVGTFTDLNATDVSEVDDFVKGYQAPDQKLPEAVKAKLSVSSISTHTSVGYDSVKDPMGNNGSQAIESDLNLHTGDDGSAIDVQSTLTGGDTVGNAAMANYYEKDPDTGNVIVHGVNGSNQAVSSKTSVAYDSVVFTPDDIDFDDFLASKGDNTYWYFGTQAESVLYALTGLTPYSGNYTISNLYIENKDGEPEVHATLHSTVTSPNGTASVDQPVTVTVKDTSDPVVPSSYPTPAEGDDSYDSFHSLDQALTGLGDNYSVNIIADQGRDDYDRPINPVTTDVKRMANALLYVTYDGNGDVATQEGYYQVEGGIREFAITQDADGNDVAEGRGDVISDKTLDDSFRFKPKAEVFHYNDGYSDGLPKYEFAPYVIDFSDTVALSYISYYVDGTFKVTVDESGDAPILSAIAYQIKDPIYGVTGNVNLTFSESGSTEFAVPEDIVK